MYKNNIALKQSQLMEREKEISDYVSKLRPALNAALVELDKIRFAIAVLEDLKNAEGGAAVTQLNE